MRRCCGAGNAAVRLGTWPARFEGGLGAAAAEHGCGSGAAGLDAEVETVKLLQLTERTDAVERLQKVAVTVELLHNMESLSRRVKPVGCKK